MRRRTDLTGRAVAVAVVVAAASGLVVPAALAHAGPGPEEYAWVSPPPGVEAAVPARGRAVDLDDGLLGTGRADVWTPDLQAVVSLEGTPPVAVALTPHDPTRFPALPGLQASGNAYEVTLDGRVDAATVLLRPPHPVTAVARLDGQAWTVVPAVPGPDGEVRVPWDGPGPYVAAAARLDGHASALGALVHDPVRLGLFLLGALGLAVGLLRWQHRRRPRPATHER